MGWGKHTIMVSGKVECGDKLAHWYVVSTQIAVKAWGANNVQRARTRRTVK
jgi:hypothetical protein